MGDSGFPGGATIRALHGGEGGIYVIELEGWFPGPSYMGRPMVGPSPFKRKLAEHQPGGSIYKGSHNLNMKGSCQALWELDLLAARGKEDLGREQMGPCSIRTWKEQGHLMIKVKEELRDKQSTSLLAKIGCGDKHFHATQILELDTTEQLELN